MKTSFAKIIEEVIVKSNVGWVCDYHQLSGFGRFNCPECVEGIIEVTAGETLIRDDLIYMKEGKAFRMKGEL